MTRTTTDDVALLVERQKNMTRDLHIDSLSRALIAARADLQTTTQGSNELARMVGALRSEVTKLTFSCADKDREVAQHRQAACHLSDEVELLTERCADKDKECRSYDRGLSLLSAEVLEKQRRIDELLAEVDKQCALRRKAEGALASVRNAVDVLQRA